MSPNERRLPTAPLKCTGFEMYGLALGKVVCRIFPHRVKPPSNALLKCTGSHPLNEPSGNPFEPVHFKGMVEGGLSCSGAPAPGWLVGTSVRFRAKVATLGGVPWGSGGGPEAILLGCGGRQDSSLNRSGARVSAGLEICEVR